MANSSNKDIKMLGLDRLAKVLPFIGKRARKLMSAEGAIALACVNKRELRITVEGSEERYRSSFVGMNDKNKKELYIDALTRNSKHDFLAPNKTRITIFFEMNGVQYHFTTKFLGLEVFGGFDSLKIRMPKTIKQGQRRKAYRIEPSLNDPAYIHLKNGDMVKALDISGAGASFRMKEPLEPGVVIPVSLKLPDRQIFLKANFEVIVTQRDSTRLRAKKVTVGEYKIRGRFRGLANASKQLIHYYVASRQRELIHLLN